MVMVMVLSWALVPLDRCRWVAFQADTCQTSLAEAYNRWFSALITGNEGMSRCLLVFIRPPRVEELMDVFAAHFDRTTLTFNEDSRLLGGEEAGVNINIYCR